jgi:hypothetical protein
LLALLLLLPLPGCEVDTTPLRPPPTPAIWAAPSFICPNEQTTVSWDAGDNFDDCTHPAAVVGGIGRTTFCKAILISNNAGLTNTPPVDRVEIQGSRSFTLAGTTTFTMEASLRETEWTHEESTLVTVVETGGRAQRFTFPGGCSGASPSWGGIGLRELLSPCVGVTAVCNVSGRILEIRSEDGRTAVVPPGDCVAELNGAADNLSARPVDFVAPPDLCGETVTSGGPPDLEIEVQVECNLDLPDCPAP